MIDDSFRLLPEQASTLAPRVDALYFFLLGVAAFFTVLIAALILYLSIKYRRGNTAVDRTPNPDRGHAFMMEIAWMVIPFLIAMMIFVWGAWLLLLGVSATGWSPGSTGGSKTMDVEISTSRRPPRDQYAPRTAWSACPVIDDLRGRDSQLLCAGVSHQARCSARSL